MPDQPPPAPLTTQKKVLFLLLLAIFGLAAGILVGSQIMLAGTSTIQPFRFIGGEGMVQDGLLEVYAFLFMLLLARMLSKRHMYALTLCFMSTYLLVFHMPEATYIFYGGYNIRLYFGRNFRILVFCILWLYMFYSWIRYWLVPTLKTKNELIN